MNSRKLAEVKIVCYKNNNYIIVHASANFYIFFNLSEKNLKKGGDMYEKQ